MGFTFHFLWEIKLIEIVQSFIMANPLFINMMIFFTYFGEPFIAVAVLAYFYFGKDKEYGKKMAIAVLGSSVFNNYLKNIVKRRRPYFDHKNILSLKTVDSHYDVMDIVGQGFSFPSGHSTNAAALMTSLHQYFKNKIILIIAIIISLFVAISRFSLGVHYPTDTIVGLLIGLSCVFAFPYAIKKFGKKKFYTLFCILGLTGFFFCKSNDFYSTLGLLIGYCLADLYEERYVRFENTSNIKAILTRIVVGIAIFLFIAEAPKLLIPQTILDANNFISYFIRFLRYFLGIFITMGVYPKCFKRRFFQ